MDQDELPVTFEHREHTVLGVATSVLGALLGFLLVAMAGRDATPGPEDFPITVKLEHLREHIGEYDALLIGRSHVWRSYVPDVLDAELERAGRPLRTFNLGGPGMADAEIDHVLRRVLDMPGQRLRYVFVETPDWLTATEDNLFTNRAVDWHTPLQLARTVRTLLRADLGWGERFARLWDHLRMTAQRFAAFGQGRRIVGALRGEEEPQPMTLEEVASGRGYQALDDLRTDDIKRRRQGFLRNRDGFPARVAAITAGNGSPFDLDRYDRASLDEQIAAIRAAGAEPVYIVPPGMDATPHAYALDAAGLLPAFLPFNRPDVHPGLYRFERRFDGHLTREGAVDASRLLARAFARLDE